MPSATVGNNVVQCAFPDVGNGSQSEAMKQILGVIDKKVRNMEKKKSKLDDYQTKKNKGERLNQDQLEALSKYQEVLNNLEFARDLQKNFITMGQEVQKAVKKTARREQLLREEMEQRRVKTVLELQFMLDQLGDETVRRDLKQPNASGSPLLCEADLKLLDEFYKLVGPERNHDIRLSEQYEVASQHWLELLEGRDKAVVGTTYKSLKETLEKLLHSSYFDKAQSHQNGTCGESEELEQTVEVESKVAEDPSEPEASVTERYTESIKVETTEFVNTQFIPETAYSSTDKVQVEEWTMEVQMVNSLLNQSPAPQEPEPTVSPCPATDPIIRKQALQDLMAQMQGTYNFMQDSILEFDAQVLDPAIVSAQPMKPVQTLDLQQMSCGTTHSESRLCQTGAMPASQESSQVFNMSAPVPPASESPVDSLKLLNQFPGGYTQGFGNQPENTVDQSDVPQQTLQSVVGGFQPQDQVLSSAGHEDFSGGTGFGQSSQSFYNSRGMPRGPRNSRGMMNGYRGSSNGFRGGYENFRPPFTNAPNSNYGQTQLNASRDISNSSYQREQDFKRVVAQGPCSLPRGNAQAMQS